MKSQYDVVVIGAGIAGLTAAYYAMKSNKSVVVIEKSAKPGGLISSDEISGVRVDTGAEAFATRHNAVYDLAEELGIKSEIIDPDAFVSYSYDVADKQAFIQPLSGVLGIPQLNEKGHFLRKNSSGEEETYDDFPLSLKALQKAAADISSPLEEDLKDRLKSRNITLGYLIESRLGTDVKNKCVTPVIKTVYGKDIDSLGVDELIPGFAQAVIDNNSVSRGAQRLKKLNKTQQHNIKKNAVESFSTGMFFLIDSLVDKLRESNRVDFVFDADIISISIKSPYRINYKTKTRQKQVEATLLINATNIATQELTSATRDEVYKIVIVLASVKISHDHTIKTMPRGSGVIVMSSNSQVKFNENLDNTKEYYGAKAATHTSSKWNSRKAIQSLEKQGLHLFRFSFDYKIWDELVKRFSVEDIIADNVNTLFGAHVSSSDVEQYCVVKHQDTGKINPSLLNDFDNSDEAKTHIYVGSCASSGSVTNIVSDTFQSVQKLMSMNAQSKEQTKRF